MSRRVHTICLALVLGALAPATASAGTAALSGSSLEVTATAGQTNDITIYEVSPNFRVEDTGPGATLSPGPGCSSGGTNIVTCPRTPVTSMTVSAGDRDDQVVNGTTYRSTLLGEADDDQLSGGSSVDILNGGPGQDVLYGGAGGDTFIGGSESDFASYSGRAAPITADLDGVADDGELGEDDNVGTDVETLIGGSAADTLTGNDLDNGLDGGPGADTLNGGLGNDYVLYWTRNPAVNVSFDGVANDGEAGENDILGADVESAYAGNGADTLTGDARSNTLIGSDGNDIIAGGGGADTLYGSGGTDLLDGGTEDDIMDGGDQADVMFGRDGTDRVTYSGRIFGVAVDPDDVADDGGLFEGDDVRSDVENLTGGSGADFLTGSSAANVLDGGASTDQVAGGAGDDTLTGGPGADTLDGGIDADTLDGGTEADVINGGSGVDRATYDGRTTAVTADPDGVNDDGEAGEADNLGADVENLTGGSGNDSLAGSADANALEGGLGDDTLSGADGDDTLNGGEGADVLRGAAGADRLTAAGGDDVLEGGSENDSLSGDSGADRIDGGSEADALDGGPDADQLDGGSGPDTLNGGDGTDELTYASRTAAVSVGLDGQANDGESGEADDARSDIENLTGGAGPDTLTGDGGANLIVPGPAPDALDGGLGPDVLDAGAGDDSVEARDQALDNVSCGTETDRVVSDPADAVAGDCETNDTGVTGVPDPPVAPNPPVDPPVDRPADRVRTKISGAPVTLGADGVARIRVACPAGRSSRCRGTVTLTLLPATKERRATGSRRSRRRAVAGRAKFSIASGKTAAVKVKISRNGRRRVMRQRKVRCSVNVSLDIGNGRKAVTKKTITVKAARRSRRR